MGLSFVPVTIASLTGVERSDAGVASGLVNTSRQIGGAVGHRGGERDRRNVDEQLRRCPRGASTASSSAALDHGFQTALYVLTGLLLVGALIAVTLVKSEPAPEAQAPQVDGDLVPLEEAA